MSCSAPHSQLSKEQIEMCKELDLEFEPSYRELCGVRQMRFQSYKNIPDQRFLLNPKNSYLVRNEEGIELRLPKTAPVSLDSDLVNHIDFSKNARTQIIKNRYEYKETFGKSSKKMFKLTIPLEDTTLREYCFSIPNRETHRTTRSVIPLRVIPIGCNVFHSHH